MVDSVFLAISVITIVSAIAALELRSLIYGSIALMGTLGGIAGFFLLLDSPFVAMIQIAVYVGSIAVLILFTVMVVKRQLIFMKKEDKKKIICWNWVDVGAHGGFGCCFTKFWNKRYDY